MGPSQIHHNRSWAKVRLITNKTSEWKMHEAAQWGPPIKKSKPPKINSPFPPSRYTRSDQISSIIKDEPTMRLNRDIYI